MQWFVIGRNDTVNINMLINGIVIWQFMKYLNLYEGKEGLLSIWVFEYLDFFSLSIVVYHFYIIIWP